MKKIFQIIIILMVLAGAAYLIIGKKNISYQINKDIAGSKTIEPISTDVGEDGLYKNSKYRFSVKLPEGYKAREIHVDDNGGAAVDSIVFEKSGGDGVQVTISPFNDIKVLTADMVKKDIPDMKMSDIQVVDIGQSYKGIAFLSDSQEFDGSSRDVWFVFKGNLYQISTYARLDDLLKSIFSTWQFQQ